MEVQHISAYSLTIEAKTALGHQYARGEIQPVADTASEEQFLSLRHLLQRNGFEQYEVSNFCKPNMHSRHNSSYWTGAHYLGLGPSAHSFNGTGRQWNIANNAQYIKGMEEGFPMFEVEVLDEKTRYNEYLMTRLRTSWGVDVSYLMHTFGVDILSTEKEQLETWQNNGLLLVDNNTIRLTEQGLLHADRIASDLFIVKS
jgi:oxygen-independent coproporphyrinogen-3 oxidase